MARRELSQFSVRSVLKIVDELPKPKELADGGFYIDSFVIKYDDETVAKVVSDEGIGWDVFIEKGWVFVE